MRLSRAMAACPLLVILCGCLLPSTRVFKDPRPCDRGVRYYRPKPYLMLKPMVNDGEPVPGYVTIETTTLPDYSEEYSIHIRSGLGTNQTAIQLTDGWNLTSLNVKLDSQFDENIGAIADLVGSLPITTGDSREPTAVRASNVPFGLYEAVLGKGSDGRKRLYGFRYVGFMPYAACPIDACGEQDQSCHGGMIFGLVFDQNENSMVFKQLHDIPSQVPSQNPDHPPPPKPSQNPNDALPLEDDGDPDALIDDIQERTGFQGIRFPR